MADNGQFALARISNAHSRFMQGSVLNETVLLASDLRIGSSVSPWPQHHSNREASFGVLEDALVELLGVDCDAVFQRRYTSAFLIFQTRRLAALARAASTDTAQAETIDAASGAKSAGAH